MAAANSTGTTVDGRVRRGERTREAIIAAHTDLVREGVLKPTGRAIAERAGISVRTVWLNFKDHEALLDATTSTWLDTDAEFWEPIDPGLPLGQRIEIFCCQRARRLEHLAPASRAARLAEPFSVALQASREQHSHRLWDDLHETFPDELGSDAEAPTDLGRGLFLAASSSGWSLLRDDLGLDVEAAAEVMRTTFAKLLGE